MILVLMLITTLISLAIAFCVLLLLGGMIERALLRVMPAGDSRDWLRFIKIATYVAALPRTIPFNDAEIIQLGWWRMDAVMFFIKLYIILVEALRGTFQALGLFFIVVAVAYAVTRAIGSNRTQTDDTQERA